MGDGLKRARVAARASRKQARLPPPGLMCPKPNYAEWSAWMVTLKTGDEVVVCHLLSGTAIYVSRVRRTPGGKLYLEDGHADRLDWSTNMTKTLSVGGERFLAPLPKETP